MRLLIDLQHPAHLHFFRNLYFRLRAEGHEVRITGRDKDILVALARSYDIDMDVFGRARPGFFALGAELFYRQLRLLEVVRDFRPDAMMAIAGTFVSLVGRMTSVPTYVFYDTEHATISNLLAYPFATCVYVPRPYLKPIRWRHRRYAGYHELAYLHPRYFTADSTVLARARVEADEPFVLVRFVGWAAAHDIGQQGLSAAQKRHAVATLKQYARVLISAEGSLPASLEPDRVHLDVADIHHLMAHARLVFGESGTMLSEAAVLGVPGIYINPLRLGYLEEQERDYGLVFNYRPTAFAQALAKGREILCDSDRGQWQKKRRRLLAEKIDVTQMLYDLAVGHEKRTQHRAGSKG